MAISENARKVLERRYLIKDEAGNATESVEDMFHRVSDAVASADKNFDPKADIKKTAKEFYKLMTDLDFLPNSPTLMNAGRPLGQLSACFVLPVEDTMEGIFETIKQAALIHKSGGGTGFSFSRIRAKGSVVNSTGGVASGPISFMKVFNMATEAVKQGGTRRGANMGILRIDHPDILEFIDCKSDTSEITNFNISVGITEEFMKAVEEGRDYDLVDPATKEVTGKLNAKDVFEKIVFAAWSNGEPGIIFLDRLNQFNVVPAQGEIESTNPCGEQPLLPYESCNLGSINLSNMLRASAGGPEVDWEKLQATVRQAVHFLDNVIEINKYPLEQIDKTTKATRKIGLGVMGFADMLLQLGISYCSGEGVALAEELMRVIDETGKQASGELAAARGNFPLYGESIYAASGKPMRNGTITTIAPTGTLSIIANCSSGVEPIFAYVYIRNIMDGTELLEVNPILQEELIRRGLYSDGLMRKIAASGTLAHIDEIPADMKRVFVSAHDVDPESHIKMQAAFQKHTDNAVSKTVNFPNEATKEDVAQVYRLAYHLGCKGVTIYRDGSRQMQVLNVGKVNKGTETHEGGCEACEHYEAMRQKAAQENGLHPRPRPEVVTGLTEKVKIGCGNLYITVNYDDNGICEVFTNTGKAGGCPSQSEATARLVSMSLRSGINEKAIVDQLRGIRCPSTIRQQGMKVTSCPDAIARVIEKVSKMRQEGGAYAAPQAQEEPEPQYEAVAGKIRFCPECGCKVEHEGGCVICRQCGYSKCS